MFLILALILVCQPVMGAELLVMAKDGPHWSHAKKGDVVDVRGDGFKWGSGACPPVFVVIKMPGMSVEEARVYLEPLVEIKTRTVGERQESYSEIIRDRKYAFPVATVEAITTAGKKDMTVPSKNLESVKASIMEKNLSVEKLAVSALKEAENNEAVK